MRIKKVKTLPPAPHPKQCQELRSGNTLKEGVFSAWNGHSPTKLRPRFFKVT